MDGNDLFKTRIEAYDFEAMSYQELGTLFNFVKVYMHKINADEKADDLLFILQRIHQVAFARIDKQFFQIPPSV